MCHLLADSDEELHKMASRIGVARRWWQSPENHSGSHYDICLSKKKLALLFGAVPITFKQCGAMNARRMETGELGNPGDAIEWLQQRIRERAENANGRAEGKNIG